MNTITQNSKVYMATEGQSLYSPKIQNNESNRQIKAENPITPNGAQVAQNIKNNIEEIKKDTQEIQKMSELLTGTKLQFNVNKELNSVIVKVVDKDTNKIVREIPSEEIQNLKLCIRKAIGNLFDEFA